MTFVTAPDGVAVAVHDLGGSGLPLIMVHAAGLHGLVLAPLARHLSGVRCLALDSRAHGDSVLPPEQDLDWYGLAADVLAVVDGKGLHRPVGFGHSSGATALLMAEESRPGTFVAIYAYEPVLVAADPPLGPDPDNALAARSRRRRRATFASREEAHRHFASKPRLDLVAPDVLQAYVDHGFAEEAGGVRLKCRPEHEAAVYETATAHAAFFAPSGTAP